MVLRNTLGKPAVNLQIKIPTPCHLPQVRHQRPSLLQDDKKYIGTGGDTRCHPFSGTMRWLVDLAPRMLYDENCIYRSSSAVPSGEHNYQLPSARPTNVPPFHKVGHRELER